MTDYLIFDGTRDYDDGEGNINLNIDDHLEYVASGGTPDMWSYREETTLEEVVKELKESCPFDMVYIVDDDILEVVRELEI